MQNEAGYVLRIRIGEVIYRRWNHLAQRTVFRIAHHADNLEFAGDNLFDSDSESPSDGIHAGKEAVDKGAVDDHVSGLRFRFVRAEVPSRKQWDAHGFKILRRNEIQAAVEKITARRYLAFRGDGGFDSSSMHQAHHGTRGRF